MIETKHETYEQIKAKECTKCKEIKPFSEFYKQKGRKFGLASNCKECNNKTGKKYRQTEKGKESSRKGTKKYQQTVKGIEVKKRATKKYRQSEKGIEVRRRASEKYEQTDKGKESRRRRSKKYRESENGKKYREVNKERTREYNKKYREELRNSFPENPEEKQKCLVCEKELTKNKIMKQQLFCSAKCMGLAHRKLLGEHRKSFRAYNWDSLTKKIRERDSYACQLCGQKENDKKHDIHHIKKYHSFKNKPQANKFTNLITLCRNCHNKIEGKEKYVLRFQEIVEKNKKSYGLLHEVLQLTV